MTDNAAPDSSADHAVGYECPACCVSLAFQLRYPRALCRDCSARTADADGRPIEYSNESLSGGLVAMYAGTHEPYTKRRCFVDGIECQADEARFGGVVVQAVSD